MCLDALSGLVFRTDVSDTIIAELLSNYLLGMPCRCHYTGRLQSNNAVFDSSYERRRPLSFKVILLVHLQGLVLSRSLAAVDMSVKVLNPSF